MKKFFTLIMLTLAIILLCGCENSTVKDVYVKDNDHVYYSDQIINDADAATFQRIPSSDEDFYFFKDKNAIYVSTGPFGGNKYLFRYEMENTENVILFNKIEIDLRYTKDNNSVYYLSYDKGTQKGRAVKLQEADVNTFNDVVGGFGYMQDKNHIYYEGKILEGADVKSFVEFKDFYSIYKDNQHVYWLGKIIEDADPNTFEVVSLGIDNYYFKDKNFVYYGYNGPIQKITGADPGSFEVIEGGNSKDKNYTYENGVKKE